MSSAISRHIATPTSRHPGSSFDTYGHGVMSRPSSRTVRRREREVPGLDLEFDPSPIPSPDQLTDQKRAREMLDAFLVGLDADMRTVFVLTELDGFTMPEIADLLDLPLGTTASRLRRAREKFESTARKIYGDEL